MAYTYTANVTPTNGSDTMFRFKANLKAVGWTVTRSSDGTTFNSSGDQITTSASGAGGFANTNAWVVLQAPTTGRQLCIQRGATGLLWWIRYSFSAGFTGGSASVAATATDQKNIAGTSATGVTILPADGGYRMNMVADGASPYGFVMVAWPSGGGSVSGLWFMDPVTAANTDPDPYTFLFSSASGMTQVLPVSNAAAYSNNNPFMRPDLTLGTNAVLVGYLQKGRAGEGWVQIQGMTYASGSSSTSQFILPSALTTDPNNDNDDLAPFLYGRQTNAIGGANLAAPNGYKGMSTLFKLPTTKRVTGDLLTVSSTGDRLVLNGCIVMPWNNTTITL